MLRIPTAVFFVTMLAPAQAEDPRLQSVLPARLAAADGNDDVDYVFGATARRVQIAYGRDMIADAGPVTIDGVAFRPDASLTATAAASWNLLVECSTGARAPSALSRTFDENHGSDRRQVFVGPTATTGAALGAPPHRFGLELTFLEPFEWDPRCGPLLLDFQIFSAGGPAFVADAVSDGIEAYGLVAHLSNPAAVTADHPSSGVERRVPAIDLLLADARTTPTSSVFSSYPFGFVSQGRAQMVYDAGVLPFENAFRITRLGWRPQPNAAYAGRTYDILVILSILPAGTAVSGLSSNFNSNLGSSPRVVYDGMWTTPDVAPQASHSFEVSLPLQHEFDYHGDGSLLIDITVRSVTGSPSARFAGSTDVRTARLVHTSNANASLGNLGPQTFALETKFGGVEAPILPVPPTPTGVGVGVQWASANAMRVLCAYDASALTAGTAAPILIRSLSWRTSAGSAYGPAAFPATIDLSTGTTTASTLSMTFDANHGNDRARLFDGVVTVPHSSGPSSRFDHPITAVLDRPFRWTPSAGPLIVDVRTPVGATAGTVGVTMAGASGQNLGLVMNRTDPNAAVANLTPVTVGFDLRLNGPSCRGSAEPYGVACGSPTAPFASATGDAVIDSTLSLTLRNAPANRIAPCGLALAPANLNLAPFGAPGCQGLTTGDLGVLWFVTNQNGAALLTVNIPNDHAMHDFTFYQQWIVLEPTAPGGFVASGGLKVTIGG